MFNVVIDYESKSGRVACSDFQVDHYIDPYSPEMFNFVFSLIKSRKLDNFNLILEIDCFDDEEGN